MHHDLRMFPLPSSFSFVRFPSPSSFPFLLLLLLFPLPPPRGDEFDSVVVGYPKFEVQVNFLLPSSFVLLPDGWMALPIVLGGAGDSGIPSHPAIYLDQSEHSTDWPIGGVDLSWLERNSVLHCRRREPGAVGWLSCLFLFLLLLSFFENLTVITS